MPPALAPATEAMVELVQRDIDHSRQMIAHADTKASFLAAGAVPFAAVLLAAPSLTDPSTAVRVVAWVGSLLLILGIGCLGSVFWPRLPSSDIGIRAGANHSASEVADRARLLAGDKEAQLASYSKEQSVLSTLALVKFRFLRAAMICFALAAVLLLVAAAVFLF